jgi:hypothetical protein
MIEVTEDQIAHRRGWIPARLDDAYAANQTYMPIEEMARSAGLTIEQEPLPPNLWVISD